MPLEFYLDNITEVAPLLSSLFKEALSHGELTPTMKQAILSPLFKDKGHNKRDDPTKYRPVSVTTIEYRILGKCIAQMLNKAVQFLIADPQVGFYPGRTYDENVALVRGTLRDLNGRRAQDGTPSAAPPDG